MMTKHLSNNYDLRPNDDQTSISRLAQDRAVAEVSRKLEETKSQLHDAQYVCIVNHYWRLLGWLCGMCIACVSALKSKRAHSIVDRP